MAVGRCLYIIIHPFLMLVFLNLLIIRQVLLARKRRETICASGKSSGRAVQERSTKLTIMLLTISFSFLVTTTPMNVYIIMRPLMGTDVRTKSRLELFKTIAEMLMYVNHSINFYVYCATGQKFRQQLLQLLCRSKNRSGHTTMFNSHKAQQTCGSTKLRNGVYIKVNNTGSDHLDTIVQSVELSPL